MKNFTLFSVSLLLLFSFNRILSQTGLPITNFSASASNVCVGEAVHFTDLSLNNPTSWLWTFKNGSPASSTLQNPVIVYNSPGIYDVILSASNENGTLVKGDLHVVKVMVCSGILENDDKFALQIYPNPAQSFVNITTRIDAQYTLYSAIGSVVQKGDLISDKSTKVSLEDLPSGIYFFSLRNGNSSKSYKLIKE